MPARRRRRSPPPVPPPQVPPTPPLRRSPRLVIAAPTDDRFCTHRRRTPTDAQPQTQQSPRKKPQRPPQQPRQSSSEEEIPVTMGATPRRKRKEIDAGVQPAKRRRTRASAAPPSRPGARSSPRSKLPTRSSMLVVVAQGRMSPEPSSPSAFSLLAQRAPLDMIDLGPALLSDNAKDDLAPNSWTSPPSPLTPLSTAPPSPTSPTSEEPPSRPHDCMDVDGAPAEPAQSQQEQGAGHPDHVRQGSSSSTVGVSQVALPPNEQQFPATQGPSQPLQPILQPQVPALPQPPPPPPHQLTLPPYAWYELQQQHESQQQILHWEEPPRLDLVKNVWKFACRYRVWDVMCRYTPHAIRSVVAQEATDYHTQHGYPSDQFHYRQRCRKRGGKGSKRRRLDLDSDKEKEKKKVPSRHVTPETNAMDLDGPEGASGSAPSSPEREKFMDEEYYDWEIRSDGEEDDEVFYYEEYDEDDDECFEEETDTEEEEGEEEREEEDGDDDMGEEQKRRSAPGTPMMTSSSLHRRKKSLDMSMDVEEEDGREEEKDGGREEEDDPSFNAELTLSCSSPTSPTPAGDEDGQCDKSSAALQPLPQPQSQTSLPPPISASITTTATGAGASTTTRNPGQVQQQQPSVKGRGDTLMSIFYCPPLPQVQVHHQLQSPRQSPTSMQVCQPHTQHHAFTLDAAQMRSPTPAPHSPSSLATTTTTTAAAATTSSPMPISVSPMSPISLSLNTSSAAPPPVLPIPPPRLSSIRVRPLRYGDLGLASVIGKGTPVDRTRAGQWARAGKERPRASVGETDKSPSVNEVVVKNESQSTSRIGPDAAEAQTRIQSSNDKMFEPDPSIWDAFLATLQQGDPNSSCHGEVNLKKQDHLVGGQGSGVTAGGGINSVETQGSSSGGVNVSGSLESVSATGTGTGTPSGTGAGIGGGATPSSIAAAATVVGATTPIPNPSASATAMNMFGMGFGLGLGMGFVSGSVNHVTALGFGGVDHGVPSSSSSSPSSSSGPTQQGSMLSSTSASAWFGTSTTPGANPGSNSGGPPNVNSLYSGGDGILGDIDMGVSGSVQTYLPLPMSMGMGMSMMGMGVGSIPVPMGMSGMIPVSMSTGGAGMSHTGHSQSGATTTMVPPAAATAAVPATAGPGTSALSFALG